MSLSQQQEHCTEKNANKLQISDMMYNRVAIRLQITYHILHRRKTAMIENGDANFVDVDAEI